MAKLILTRFLYIFDEVCISFLTSLLKKQTLDECYFWMSELYLSGFHAQSWDLIWFIYYDFYYIHSPFFEEYLSKKHSTNDLKSIISVVKNMFKMKSSSQVFITRQYNNQVKEITRIFRGKKPNWLLKYPSKYHALFRFIDKQLYHFAVSSLPNGDSSNGDSSNGDDLFDAIKMYFNIPEEQFTPLLRSLQNNTSYDNPFHKLWSLICLFIFNPSYHYTKQRIYISCSKSEYNDIMDLHNNFTSIHISPSPSTQSYKVLEYTRKYAINPLCSSFYLSRDSYPDISNELGHKWEYHAYYTPIWLERFNQYNINIHDDTNEIEFTCDEEAEQFYSNYGYEPDEQSIETQNKAIHICSDNNWNKWYEYVFQDSPIFNYNIDFKFAY